MQFSDNKSQEGGGEASMPPLMSALLLMQGSKLLLLFKYVLFLDRPELGAWRPEEPCPRSYQQTVQNSLVQIRKLTVYGVSHMPPSLILPLSTFEMLAMSLGYANYVVEGHRRMLQGEKENMSDGRLQSSKES